MRKIGTIEEFRFFRTGTRKVERANTNGKGARGLEGKIVGATKEVGCMRESGGDQELETRLFVVEEKE